MSAVVVEKGVARAARPVLLDQQNDSLLGFLNEGISMIYRTAAELSPLIGATPRDIDNWITRLELATGYEAPGRGVPRRFSKWNAFELGMIAALTRGGALPSESVAIARRFVQDAKRGWRGTAFRRWLVFRSNDCSRGVHTDQFDASQLIAELGAITVSVVHVRKLVDTIEQLFLDEEA